MNTMAPDEALVGLQRRKFIKPKGWRYSTALSFWDGSGEFLGHLAINRTKAQGDITNEEMELLNRIRPNLPHIFEKLRIPSRRRLVTLSSVLQDRP